MIFSALLACLGQLCWKLLSNEHTMLLFIAGAGLYGLAALLMIYAMRFGELSVLHPMLSTGYILSVILGSLVLHERISAAKVLGIACIIAGLVFLTVSDGRHE